MTSIIRLGSAALVVAALLPLAPASAQRIADRVADAPDGSVRFAYASKPDVCGNGEGGITIMRGGELRTSIGTFNPGYDYRQCEFGPVRVSLRIRGGRVTDVRTRVGGAWRDVADVTDLGMVSVRDATDYLLSLASNATGSVAKEAIFPAILADSVEVWPALLRLAKDDSRPRETRRQALFWVGQAAGDSVTARLDDVASDVSEDRDVREAAIFALSQRPNAEGIPALIRVAKTNRDPELRRKALFWLSQKDDPRVTELFEEILFGRR